MQQISNTQLLTISERLRASGYLMRSGSNSDIYYITARQTGLFGAETYCLIFEDDGWRISTISANGDPERRAEIEATVRAVLAEANP